MQVWLLVVLSLLSFVRNVPDTDKVAFSYTVELILADRVRFQTE